MLWLGLDGALDALTHLQHEANGLLGGEARPYRPHVTLARGNQLEPVEAALREVVSPSFKVVHLTLYESTHDRYQVLSRHAFRTREGS